MIVCSTTLPDNFFAKKPFVFPCTLKSLNNQILLYALVDNGAIGYGFINSSLARTVCHDLNILPFRLAKPRIIKAYNGRLGKPVTHVLYVRLVIEKHSEYDCLLLITDLDYDIILGKLWICKYGPLLDIRDHRLIFLPSRLYDHASFTLPLSDYAETAVELVDLIAESTPLSMPKAIGLPPVLRKHVFTLSVSESSDSIDLSLEVISYRRFRPLANDSTIRVYEVTMGDLDVYIDARNRKPLPEKYRSAAEDVLSVNVFTTEEIVSLKEKIVRAWYEAGTVARF